MFKLFINTLVIATLCFSSITMAEPMTEGFHYQIRSKHSGKCLDLKGHNKENYAEIQQFDCHGGANQRWYQELHTKEYDPFRFNLPGYIVSLTSHRCLDVNSRRVYESRVPIQQYGCHGGDNQRWLFEWKEDRYYSIISKQSGKCLDVWGGSRENNAIIQQFDCHGGDNQLWEISDPKPIQSISNKSDLMALDWCYVKEDSGYITFYPIIANVGQETWMSTKEGIYRMGVDSTGSFLYENPQPLSYPELWLPPNREKKLKKGIPIVFDDDSDYSFSWMFTHDDDLNPHNNTHAGIVATGREFRSGGNMTHKECPQGSSQLFYPVSIYTHPDFNGSQSKLRLGDYSNLNKHHDGWANNIDSIKISANTIVTAWSHPNFSGKQYGPYIGPKNIPLVDGPNDWDSVKVERH